MLWPYYRLTIDVFAKTLVLMPARNTLTRCRQQLTDSALRWTTTQWSSQYSNLYYLMHMRMWRWLTLSLALYYYKWYSLWQGGYVPNLSDLTYEILRHYCPQPSTLLTANPLPLREPCVLLRWCCINTLLQRPVPFIYPTSYHNSINKTTDFACSAGFIASADLVVFQLCLRQLAIPHSCVPPLTDMGMLIDWYNG